VLDTKSSKYRCCVVSSLSISRIFGRILLLQEFNTCGASLLSLCERCYGASNALPVFMFLRLGSFPLIQVTKRWFKCGSCGHRTSSVARRFPEWRCDRCRMQDWQPCSMYIIPKVILPESSCMLPVMSCRQMHFVGKVSPGC
jgi:hypothetical protein